MPAPKMYTKAQWDEFVRLLDALPEKPPSEQRITVRDAMPNVRVHIDAARAKGYSVEQLIDQAKRAGIDVTASALRYALQEAKRRRGTTRRMDGTSGARNRTNTSHNQSAKPAAGQQTRLASQSKTERENRKPGSMVIQDAFSFQIRPDTEDL
ncbi:hypothetical protein LMG27952_00794 [Paraburkholderia hiiakae]|uniref:Uncharacterized protein n=1 Tax=Paraburkholderia hiiakae TaxID=1081782 RepID=A0ABM8NBJ0_9BURK|nr:hypothetical protein [Paraburkholderia hiiakae]CAD6513849.1 hypothetical protein LMG27952_00794 [Paraburkholderia hiiakae]